MKISNINGKLCGFFFPMYSYNLSPSTFAKTFAFLSGKKKVLKIFLCFWLPFAPSPLLAHTVVQSHCFSRTVGVREIA